MTTEFSGKFHGGLILPRHKSLSTKLPIGEAGLPSRLYFPLRQRSGNYAELLIHINDRVLRGSQLAGGQSFSDPPIYASTSGRIIAIENHPTPNRSGSSDMCIILEPDGLDESVDPLPSLDLRQITSQAVLNRIHQAGTIGQGGAGFPTATKLSGGQPAIDLLIINGAECEPYITCDDMLMRERAEQVLSGADVLRRCFSVRETLIAVEADMADALQAISSAKVAGQFDQIKIVKLPVRYPIGGERQLIETLTGRQVPSGKYPISIGVVCLNVATTAAIYRALAYGEVVVSRIVTVTGQGVHTPQNLEVRLGTPIAQLVEICGGFTKKDVSLILGGPMMGSRVSSYAIPVTKHINAILVVDSDERHESTQARPCIRCGACADVCPARLLPQELLWHIQSGQIHNAIDEYLLDCIECSCCDLVCPSHIPLVEHFRTAKDHARTLNATRAKANLAKLRYEARLDRKSREHHEQIQTAQTQKSRKEAGPSAKIKEALERAKLKQINRPDRFKQDTGNDS